MKKSVKKLQIGNFISVLLDFLVMLTWLASFRFGGDTLLPVMLFLTALHASFIWWIYHFINRSGMIYAMPIQQKYLILGMLIATSLLCLISALMGGNASTLFVMLINGAMVLSYPNSRFAK